MFSTQNSHWEKDNQADILFFEHDVREELDHEHAFREVDLEDLLDDMLNEHKGESL